jgi:hypothetical protein
MRFSERRFHRRSGVGTASAWAIESDSDVCREFNSFNLINLVGYQKQTDASVVNPFTEKPAECTILFPFNTSDIGCQASRSALRELKY